MTSEAFSHPSGLWRIEVTPTYRQLIAAGIVTSILAYVLVIYPLGYYGQFVAADAVGPGAVQEVAPSLLNRIFFPLAALLSLTVFVLERHRAAQVNWLVALPLVLFLGYCGLSSFWSLDPSTSASKFIVLVLVLAAIFPAVAVVDSADRYFRPMFWVAVATLLINLLFVLFTAPTPIGAAGIYSHKNSLGGATAFCVMFLFYGLALRGKLYKTIVLLMLPIAFFILFRSQAKTSLALALIVPFIAGGFTLARYYFRLPMPLLFGLLAVVVPFVVMTGVLDFSASDISIAISGDPTFTGRTDLWNFALEKIAERPWFGYGFHAFWQVGDISPAWSGPRGFLQRTPHAHEGYLDVLLQGGVVGFCLFVGVIVTVANWISRATDEMPWGGLMFASVFIFEGLVNLLESNWFDPLDPATAILLTFIATAMVKRPILPPQMIVREVAR